MTARAEQTGQGTGLRGGLRGEPREERWAPECFYWAELDVSDLPRPLFPTLAAASRRRQLGYLLEPLLPVDLESVCAVYKEDGNRAIACAVPASRLAELDPNIASLVPTDWAEFIADPPGWNPAELNILRGAHPPRCVRARRARLAWTAALLMLACAVATSVGLGRRASREREVASALSAARHDVHALVLEGVAGAPGTDPDMLVRSELNRLTRTRTVVEDDAVSAAQLLASVLGAWPHGTQAQTSSISVTPELVTVAALITDPDEAQRLTDALGSLDGWRADNPSVSPERDAIRTTVRIRREDGP